MPGLFTFTVIYASCFTPIKAGLAFVPTPRYWLHTLIGGVALFGLMAAFRNPLLPPRRS